MCHVYTNELNHNYYAHALPSAEVTARNTTLLVVSILLIHGGHMNGPREASFVFGLALIIEPIPGIPLLVTLHHHIPSSPCHHPLSICIFSDLL